MKDGKGLLSMKRLTFVLAAVALLAVAGCGDDNDDDGGSSDQAGGGLLFSQNTRAGTLTPAGGGDGAFELTLTEPAAGVTAFTDRPERSAETESLADFVADWDDRGFGTTPPNAALVLDGEPEDANTAVFTISDPKLDEASGALTYQATRVTDTTAALPDDDQIEELPSEFGGAHLFIDPSSGDTHGLYLDARIRSATGKVQLTFDSPWTVILGAGDSGVGYILSDLGGGEIIPSKVSMTAGHANMEVSIEFAVSGGTGPVTGTASLPSGATATLELDDGPSVPIKNGKFSIGGS